MGHVQYVTMLAFVAKHWAKGIADVKECGNVLGVGRRYEKQ